MNWNKLTSIEQLDSIDAESEHNRILLFKHSTRCSISATALNRLERNWQSEDSQKLKPYYLDLLNHRDVSNAIAARYGVIHESPQALVIQNGRCIYVSTHTDITYSDLLSIN